MQRPGVYLFLATGLLFLAACNGGGNSDLEIVSQPLSDSLDCSMDGCPEIFAWGFRNPWRWSFDPVSGQLWVGDVGQADWEEIDRVEMGNNYGRNTLEGTQCFIQPDCNATGLTPPIIEYNHDLGSSVTGGYIYRGTAIADLDGDYLYGDFGSGRIWRLIQAAQGGSRCELLLNTELNISSFAQDRNGEIYIVSYSDGAIYKLVPAGAAVGGRQ